MALRLAGAGAQIGMSEADILGLATALSSVGIEAEAGGSSFSKVMVKMQLACEEGGESLEDFAKVAGMSSSKFQTAFKEDATGAIVAFIQGLAGMDEKGVSAIATLNEMGLTEVRLRDALLRSANSADIFTNAIGTANTAWDENSALTEEAAKRYETVQSKIEILKNKIFDLGISLGEKLLPHVEEFIDWAADLVEWFGNLDEGTQKWILKLGLLGVAIGTGVTLLGKFTSGIGSVVSGIGSVIELIGKWALKQAGVSTALGGTATALSGMSTATSAAAGGLGALSTKASLLSTICNPLTLGIGALVTAIAAIGIAWYKNEKKCEEGARQLREVGFAAEDLQGKVKGTSSVIDRLFGHEYDIKFSDSYKESTRQVEENVKSWHDRLVELQKNINEVLNDTKIDEGTKQEQVKSLVQPWIDELTQGNEQIAQNIQEMSSSVADYAKNTFDEGSKSYEEFMDGYNEFSGNYKTIYENDQQELQSIYQKLCNGEIELTDELRGHILDIREDMAEAEKNLQMTNAEDYLNQLELNGERERAIYKNKMENIQKYTDDTIALRRDEVKASKEAAIEEQQALYQSGAISKEVYEQRRADIEAQAEKQNMLAEVTANSYGAMALASQDFAEQNGLHFEKVAGDVEGLYRVYDENGNAIRAVFATNEQALQSYASTHGGTCQTIMNSNGAMTRVVVDENGIVIAQLASNEYAWKNNAQAVVNALKTEINSVKNGERSTSQAMEVIKAKLASGEISAQDFGFTSEEAFLQCARSALDAKGDVNQMQSSIDSLHGKEVDVKVNTSGVSAVEHARDVVNSLRDRNVNVTYTVNGGVATQLTRGGQFTITAQGSHGSFGEDTMVSMNESELGWELYKGSASYLGTIKEANGRTRELMQMGMGASVIPATTSYENMLKAVKYEVADQLNDVYLDYANSASAASRMAFNFGNPQQVINNNSNFDDNRIISALYEVIGAITGINLNPTISLNPKGLAKSLTPYIDRELDIRSKRR